MKDFRALWGGWFLRHGSKGCLPQKTFRLPCHDATVLLSHLSVQTRDQADRSRPSTQHWAFALNLEIGGNIPSSSQGRDLGTRTGAGRLSRTSGDEARTPWVGWSVRRPARHVRRAPAASIFAAGVVLVCVSVEPLESQGIRWFSRQGAQAHRG